MRPLCPSYAYFGYFAYAAGGRGYICQGILEDAVQPSTEVAQVAMNCLLCGACASMCPPGFDTIAFIRDLRDYLASRAHFINDTHEELLEKARSGQIWSKTAIPGELPVFSGSDELVVFLGARERSQWEIIKPVQSILDAADIGWGLLEHEPCSGAPLADLGDMKAFHAIAEKNIELVNATGAERVLALCPHDASVMIRDYMSVGDLEPEVVTLPDLIDELIDEGQVELGGGDPLTATYQDPCRLGRYLEDYEAPRKILKAMNNVDLVEMELHSESSWCCGSGAWAELITPELSEETTRKRIMHARQTAADCIVTACSYCTARLKGSRENSQDVIHIAELVASRLKSARGASQVGRG
jgi:Fe-S oxidoreductase